MRHVKMAGVRRITGMQTWIMASAVFFVMWSVSAGADHGRYSRVTISRERFDAHELFVKIWEPKARGLASGDGLGPLFNETSCVGCHHLGGTGGAGGNKNNVVILTAFGGTPSAQTGEKLFVGELEDLHPGFRNRSSVVVHDHATDPALESRLSKMKSYDTVQARDDLIQLRQSQRNTPALFGAGIIDAIPDNALLEAEKRRFPNFPEIKGKASRLQGGQLGRFGWKGQTSRLRDFVLNACANELGLEVPGHHQMSLAPAKEFDPQKFKLDLDKDQCDLLVSFVASLPPPLFRGSTDLAFPSWGYTVFENVGCATCHLPRLGPARGIYSDLLLHDMGDRMRDFGGYGMSSSRIVDRAKDNDKSSSPGDVAATDWRTPPLWGVADSAAYLHDGRASTLDEAVRLHGGEAAPTSERYTKLAPGDRRALLAFLQSQTVGLRPREHATGKAKRNKGNPKKG
jgi:CxxC motif-containing protein (DUF1111 family)